MEPGGSRKASPGWSSQGVEKGPRGRPVSAPDPKRTSIFRGIASKTELPVERGASGSVPKCTPLRSQLCFGRYPSEGYANLGVRSRNRLPRGTLCYPLATSPRRGPKWSLGTPFWSCCKETAHSLHRRQLPHTFSSQFPQSPGPKFSSRRIQLRHTFCGHGVS